MSASSSSSCIAHCNDSNIHHSAKKRQHQLVPDLADVTDAISKMQSQYPFISKFLDVITKILRIEAFNTIFPTGIVFNKRARRSELCGSASCTSSSDIVPEEELIDLVGNIISRAKQSLVTLKSGVPNSFDHFDVEIAEIEFNLVVEYSLTVLNALYEEHIVPSQFFNQIIDITAKMLWFKCFGTNESISWQLFMQQINNVYPNHFSANNIEILKSALCENMDNCDYDNDSIFYRNPSSNNAPLPCSGTCSELLVTVDMFAKFVNNHNISKGNNGGFYSVYQRVCDPGTILMMSGILDNTETMFTIPTVMKSLLGYKIKKISCGGQHVAVIANDGVLLTWGRGDFGRLGLGNNVTTSTPSIVDFGGSIGNKMKRIARIADVSCGFAYTVAVTDAGIAYSWGAGENGRLGLGDTRGRSNPAEVTALNHEVITAVAAGSVHTVFLTNRGEVYTNGKCEYAGHGARGDVLLPTLVTFPVGPSSLKRRVEVISMSVGPGGYHTIVLSSDNRIYSWGHNRVGQLGISNQSSFPVNSEGAYYIPTPVQVTNLPGDATFTQVSAGWGHSALITTEGDVYTCGRNVHGQLGLGPPSKFPVNERGHAFLASFTKVEVLQARKCRKVVCGGEHSIFLCDDEYIAAAGAGSKGQLGQLGSSSSIQQEYHIPTSVASLCSEGREIIDICCGNHSTFMLLGKYQPKSLKYYSALAIKTNPTLLSKLVPFSAVAGIEHENGCCDGIAVKEEKEVCDESFEEEYIIDDDMHQYIHSIA